MKTFLEPVLAIVSPDKPEYSEAKRLYEFLGYLLPINVIYGVHTVTSNGMTIKCQKKPMTR